MKIIPKRVVLFLLVSFLSPSLFSAEKKDIARSTIPPTQNLGGRVVAISPGLVIDVATGKKTVKVRLWGIDTSWYASDFLARAKKFAEKSALRKNVRVDVRGVDHFGWSLGVVTLPDGKILNHELVREGLAWWVRDQAPADEILKKLEIEARKEKRGLWVEQTFVSEACARRRGICTSPGESVACEYRDPATGELRNVSGSSECQVTEDIRFDLCLRNLSIEEKDIRCMPALGRTSPGIRTPVEKRTKAGPL